MIELQDAIKINNSLPLPSLKTLQKDLFEAQGYILAQDYFITRPLPLFDNSAMDGYAISSKQQGEILHCTRSIFAGEDATKITLKENEAIKIMTGAMIPQNADIVVPFELANLENGVLNIHKKFQPYDNIRKQGEEKKIGDLIAKKGSKLDFTIIGLLASQGIAQVQVFEKLKIGVFSTGDEIIDPKETALPHQIYNINAPSILAILQKYQFDCSYLGILKDNEGLEEALLQATAKYSLLITSGGASVGEKDLLEKILLKHHATIFYHKINLKPGKPLMIAQINGCYLFCLPGNPLSGILNLLALLIPTILRLGLSNAYTPITQYGILKTPLCLKGNRAQILLGTLQDGYFIPYLKHSPNAISTFYHCTHFAVFDSKATMFDAGSKVMIFPYFGEFDQKSYDFINYAKQQS